MDNKFLQMGEYYVTKKPMLLETLLGSCVSVCLYNKFNGSAAMNHFLIPSAGKKDMKNDPGKYGESSCEMIIRSLMSLDPDASHYSAIQREQLSEILSHQSETERAGNAEQESNQEAVSRRKLRLAQKIRQKECRQNMDSC